MFTDSTLHAQLPQVQWTHIDLHDARHTKGQDVAGEEFVGQRQALAVKRAAGHSVWHLLHRGQQRFHQVAVAYQPQVIL